MRAGMFHRKGTGHDRCLGRTTAPQLLSKNTWRDRCRWNVLTAEPIRIISSQIPRHRCEDAITKHDRKSTLKILYPLSVIVGRSLQAMYPAGLSMNRRFGLSDQNEQCSQEVTRPDGCSETLADCDTE